MAEYDEAAFNADLNENMADDPYGTAMYLIVEALRAAKDNEGMNDHEAEILADVEAIIHAADPAALSRNEDHYRILRENQEAARKGEEA
jgi:hypothetical protein